MYRLHRQRPPRHPTQYKQKLRPVFKAPQAKHHTLSATELPPPKPKPSHDPQRSIKRRKQTPDCPPNSSSSITSSIEHKNRTTLSLRRRRQTWPMRIQRRAIPIIINRCLCVLDSHHVDDRCGLLAVASYEDAAVAVVCDDGGLWGVVLRCRYVYCLYLGSVHG